MQGSSSQVSPTTPGTAQAVRAGTFPAPYQSRTEVALRNAFRKPVSATLLAILLAIVLTYPFLDEFFNLQKITDVLPIMMYILLALGLNVVVGYAGLLDLGYAAFFALVAYTAR